MRLLMFVNMFIALQLNNSADHLLDLVFIQRISYFVDVPKNAMRGWKLAIWSLFLDL